MEEYIRMMAATLVAAATLVSCEESSILQPEFSLASEAEIHVSSDGGRFNIFYSVENPAEDGEVTAITGQNDWIENLDTETSGSVSFDVAANEIQEARQGTISVAYEWPGGRQAFEVYVSQDGASGADGPDPGTEPDYADAFSIEVTDITESEATLKAVCKYDELYWTADIIDKEDFDLNIAGIESLMQSYLTAVLQDIALSYGYTSIKDFLPEYLFQGCSEQDKVLTGLIPETDFIPYAVGIDFNMNFTTAFHYGQEFSTADPPKGNLTFEFEVDAMETSATMNVYASDKEAYYYATFIDSSYFGAGFHDNEIMMDILGEYGADLIYNLYQDDLTGLESGGMIPDLYYYAIAFGVDPETGFYNTGLFKYEFKTIQPEKSDAYAEGSMDNYWLITDLTDYNPDYASLAGSEDLLAALDIRFNDSAASAVCAVFVGDLSDVDQYELYRTTLVQGSLVNKGDAARLVYMSYNDPCSICVVGKDAEGYNGEMSLTVVNLDEDGTSHDYALFDEYYNNFFGSSGSSVKAMSPTMLITK